MQNTEKRKELGKINTVKFGKVGYQECEFGLSLDFTFKGSGVGTTIANSWSLDLKSDKWSENDRDIGNAKTMRQINQLLIDAKVDDVYKLKGIPVEVTFKDYNTFESFRILTEVI